MAFFVCPFCGGKTSISTDNCRKHFFTFKSIASGVNLSAPYLEVSIYRCPNEDCKKETVIASGINGYIENRVVPIYPEVIFRHFPDYIPEAIRKDYEEACSILDRSPKASATLARRCLQGMIRDFWGISGKNLNDEIDQLQGKIPAAQWSAINALRQLGNIGAHMEKDTSLIVDINPDEAKMLLNLIELLLEKWYIGRHDEEALYASITATNQKKQDQRHPSELPL